VEYGIALSAGGMTIDEMVEVGRRADASDVNSVYCVEAYRSALIPLAAIAQHTARLKVGSYIMNAYGRSPLMTAMSAIDFDELCGGRFVLCIGVGNRHINEKYQGIPVKRPARKMEEYISIVRQMVRAIPGETVSFAGEIHGVDEWPPAVHPVRPSIPVYLAAIHPAMRRVVGRAADGLAMGSLCSPEYLQHVVRPGVIDGAVSAGRDPGALRFLMACLVGVDDDREAARTTVRRAITRMFWPLPHPYYEFLLREQGFGAAADAAAKYVPEGKIEKAMDAFSDELVDSIAVAGTPAECRERLRCYAGLADEVIMVNPALPTPRGSIDRGSFVASYDQLMACAS
jgi:5,10-methylenetetrahydromethanopterin reductase